MPAPVALFTYNRPGHTRATLDALSRNHLAARTAIYIFSDGAKTESDLTAVAEVRDIIRGTAGFESVKVIERPSNLGLATSIITGVSELLDRYDDLIVLEDDLLSSPQFLTYMNSALRHYQEDELAFSITGFSYPQPYFMIPSDYEFDTYAAYRCCSWSWGTWRDRWRLVDWSMAYYPEFQADRDAQDRFNRGGADLTNMLRAQHKGAIDSWAIRFCYAHFANRMLCVYPTETLVRNMGLDGSGTHSDDEPRYAHLSLNNDWLPDKFCEAGAMDEKIIRSFRSVFDEPEQVMSVDHTTRLERATRWARALFRRAVSRDAKHNEGPSD